VKRGLIVWGGWDGHEPEAVAGIFQGILESAGFAVEVSDSQDALADQQALKALDVIARLPSRTTNLLPALAILMCHRSNIICM